MTKKKDISIKHIILRISLAAEIVAFLIVALFFGGLIWVFASTDEGSFEIEYEAAKQKYDKYYHKIVSGQEVLDLIDNWDETDFEMTVENIKDQRFRVSNLDEDNTICKYWDKESSYYIDPDAFYKGGFILFQNPRVKSDKGIGELCFHLVEDPSLSEDNTTENDD